MKLYKILASFFILSCAYGSSFRNTPIEYVNHALSGFQETLKGIHRYRQQAPSDTFIPLDLGEGSTLIVETFSTQEQYLRAQMLADIEHQLRLPGRTSRRIATLKQSSDGYVFFSDLPNYRPLSPMSPSLSQAIAQIPQEETLVSLVLHQQNISKNQQQADLLRYLLYTCLGFSTQPPTTHILEPFSNRLIIALRNLSFASVCFYPEGLTEDLRSNVKKLFDNLRYFAHKKPRLPIINILFYGFLDVPVVPHNTSLSYYLQIIVAPNQVYIERYENTCGTDYKNADGTLTKKGALYFLKGLSTSQTNLEIPRPSYYGAAEIYRDNKGLSLNPRNMTDVLEPKARRVTETSQPQEPPYTPDQQQ